MDEMDPSLREFLVYWFSGLLQGLEELDEAGRKKVLHACGRACAQSYTAQRFRKDRQSTTDMDAFLQKLARSFPGASYDWDGDRMIRVTYRQCGCDLVRLGLVKAPSFCECTVANLSENFRQALGVPVTVVLETSILRGSARCSLTVSF